ncbi:MAG: hypothetical protein ACJART_000022 [Maribacter sp.]|jgi:hypothetical protein
MPRGKENQADAGICECLTTHKTHYKAEKKTQRGIGKCCLQKNSRS